MLIGKERHDVGRPGDVGYPIRGIVKDHKLYLMNFETSRWPTGNPEAGYPNVDASPTKTSHPWTAAPTPTAAATGSWPSASIPPRSCSTFSSDPDCLVNLAADPAWAGRKRNRIQGDYPGADR